jgi:ATF/CREB family transcription factor
LQTKVDVYQSENDALQSQVAQLREEVVNLKTLLLAHKDCPVTQQAAMTQGPYMPPMDQYPQAQMGHYQQLGQMNNFHPSMIPAGSNRRPS